MIGSWMVGDVVVNKVRDFKEFLVCWGFLIRKWVV